MNSKHMNSVLSKVFNEFADSITDETVKNKVKAGTIITGGALVSLLTGDKVNDYDMYFKDFDTCYAVAQYYTKLFSERTGHKADTRVTKEGSKIFMHKDDALAAVSAGETPRVRVFIQSHGVASDATIDEHEEDSDEMETNITPSSDLEAPKKETPKYIPKFLSSNAISLSGKVQLVIRFYGEPDKIHANYDFVHCTNYWTSWDKKVVLKQDALEAIINKELRYVGSKYPLCSIIRTRKFINRGWSINAGQYLKMCMQLNELNLKDINVLEDQLVGVDSAYFSMLIRALEAKQQEDPFFAYGAEYISAIIDKIF